MAQVLSGWLVAKMRVKTIYRKTQEFNQLLGFAEILLTFALNFGTKNIVG